MPPSHNWRVKLQLMLATFFSPNLPCENKSSIPAATLLHSHCARIPMATDMCNSLPSPLPFSFSSTRRALSSPRKLRELEREQTHTIFHNDLQSQDAVEGWKDVFHNNVSTQKSLLVQLVAIGNCRNWGHGVKSSEHGEQAGSRWDRFTMTRRDSLLYSKVSAPKNNIEQVKRARGGYALTFFIMGWHPAHKRIYIFTLSHFILSLPLSNTHCLVVCPGFCDWALSDLHCNNIVNWG